ncbi:MAG: glycosyltransferase family 2 protein [Magnetococcales bacterium]|nr:glycosyltransferase family 2 protein [Magnetococcales bacterium]
MSFALILPTLNEIDGLRATVPRLDRGLFERIVVVDGGSTDGTVAYAREQGLEVIFQEGRELNNAQRTAFLQVDSAYVIMFSPDGNCIPELLPRLCGLLAEGNHDLVIVSRYLDGARSDDDDLLTGFGNGMFTGIINLLFRARFTDTLSIFRGYRSEAIRAMNLPEIARESRLRATMPLLNSWEVASCLRAPRLGLRCGEIAGDEPARIGGIRKMGIVRNGLATVGAILLDFFFYWPHTEPQN